jgi:hypothetical protein
VDRELWTEVIGAIGDILGLWGAYLLAWPFVRTQHYRDLYLTLHAATPGPSDEDFEHAKRIATEGFLREISERAPREYRRGVCGAVLIAAAFGLRLIPFVISLIGMATQLLK